MPRKTFVAGEVLAAADVNEFLADQVIMTFAGTAARGSAISVPVEGMVTYLEDDDQLEVYGGTAVGWSSASNFIFGTAVPTDGQVASYSTAVSGWVPADASSGKILQVVSTTKTDTFSTTSDSYVDVTGLSVTITPSSASNKILILAQVAMAPTNIATSGVHMRINGGNASNYVGDAAGNRSRDIGFFNVDSGANGLYYSLASMPANYLDSPSTTSAVTYTVQVRRGTTSGTVYVNRNDTDADLARYGRAASTITVMEIAG